MSEKKVHPSVEDARYFKNFLYRIKQIASLSFVILFLIPVSFASTPSASQQMSAQERARQMQKESENLQNQIEQPSTKTKPEEKAMQELPAEILTVQKIFVKSINVVGVTIFSNEKIEAITSQYENKELTLQEAQKIADCITDLYRKKGYVLSRAYLPAQKMDGGILEIRVIESKIGDVQLKGNRFYSTHLIESYLTVKKGEPFNYNNLKRDLDNINEHPDRNVKSVLVPGKEPGSTDIILDEKDSLPIHVSLGYNNFLSRSLGRNIYSSTFTDNNLSGRDDILSFDYERADANDYYSYSTNYLYPVTRSLDLGVYTSHSRQALGGEFSDVDARGTSSVYGVYGIQNLIKNDDLSSNFNFGFDYIDVYNFLLGEISSKDRLRVAKIGFDFNLNDDFGRTLIRYDFNYGIPGIIGGTEDHLDSTDTPTSRSGATGEFAKNNLSLFRLEILPFDSTLLWKNQFQFSSSKLTSTEQFQAGGSINNRGYSVAESVGDQGYSMSWELARPPYFIPRSWKIPFTHTQIYNAFRVFEFYDWSNVHLNSLQPGDEKNRTLSSVGGGARLNIMTRLSASYQIGWPLMGKSSDAKNVQQWVEVSVTF